MYKPQIKNPCSKLKRKLKKMLRFFLGWPHFNGKGKETRNQDRNSILQMIIVLGWTIGWITFSQAR